MKKLILFLTTIILAVSCYDDSKLLQRMDNLEQVTIAAIQTSITTLESSNAELKTRIEQLENSKSATETEINDLKTKQKNIEGQITDLKSWVEQLIKGYYTKDEIDTQLDSINETIKSINDSIAGINARLNGLLREFKITFDESEIGILPGGTSAVDYVITGATGKTIVKAMGQGLWHASVKQLTDSTGTITVQAPDPLTEDEIIVIVYDGEYRTIMSSINFVKGLATPSEKTVELSEEAGSFEISVNTNMVYEVCIPESDKNWLALVETKAMRTDVLSFTYKANGNAARKARVSLKDEAGNEISSFLVFQNGEKLENYQIKYVTSNDQALEINEEGLFEKFGANLKSNVYANGKGILTFDKDITKIGEYAFRSNSELVEIILPETVKEIGMSAFSSCLSLSSIYLPKGLISIGADVFSNCSNLSSIKIPETVTFIGYRAFLWCENLVSINIPEGVTSIEDQTFQYCFSLTSVTIPENVTLIKLDAFRECTSLESITIPKGVAEIEARAFLDCTRLASVYFKAENCPVGSFEIFDGNADGRKIYVPMESVDAYKSNQFWSEYADDIVGYDYSEM